MMTTGEVLFKARSVGPSSARHVIYEPPVDFAWQYHLQQMVLEKNPIDYLRKFVEDEKRRTEKRI